MNVWLVYICMLVAKKIELFIRQMCFSDSLFFITLIYKLMTVREMMIVHF